MCSGWQTLGAEENAKLEEAFVQNLNRVPLVLDGESAEPCCRGMTSRVLAGRQMLVWVHRMVAIDVDLGHSIPLQRVNADTAKSVDPPPSIQLPTHEEESSDELDF